MKTWTVHLRPGTAPALIPEAFSLPAALFAPLWLVLHSAWVPAAVSFCAEVAVVVGSSGTLRIVLMLLLVWLFGLIGQDLRRWALAQQGFVLAHVVAAQSGDAAAARLLDQRPELAREAAA